MPNDANGKPLEVGDRVTIPATVTTVKDDLNYVNCTVELEHPLPPTGAKISQSLNSQQLEKVGDEKPAGAAGAKPATPSADEGKHPAPAVEKKK